MEDGVKEVLKIKPAAEPVSLQPVPEGKVRLNDGRIIDRIDVAYKLREHPENSSILRASDKAVYMRDEKGTLRRLTPREGKKVKRLKGKKGNNNGN